MGYDMYMIDEDIMSEDFAYFRANINGMRALRDFMEKAGVIEWKTPTPHFPTLHEGVTEEERTQAYSLVRNKLGDKFGYIPGYKFCSNDGWIVTPEECKIIAVMCESLFDEIGSLVEYPEFIKEWIEFNARAVEFGGYSVW